MSSLAIFGGPKMVDTPLTPFNCIGGDELAAAQRVIESGFLSGFIGAPGVHFDGGPEVRALEEAWSIRFKTKHSVSMNSATSCLYAAAGAAGVSPGDEVVVPPYTMSATVMAPIIYGATPVFADIDAETFCLDPDAVRAAITDRTRAIMAVNLFGHPARLHKLRAIADERGIVLIEDSAQAPLASEDGKLAGTIGHIGVFSLNRHKHIQTGEGGMCVTDDDELSLRLRLIRNHGENAAEALGVQSIANMVGFNYRLTEFSAAIARCQLNHADEIIDRRVAVAERLSQRLADVPGLNVPLVRPNCRHTYYVWAATLDSSTLGVSRGAFTAAVRAEGVPVHDGYVRPLYHLPIFQKATAIGQDGYPFNLTGRTYDDVDCVVCESLYAQRLFWFGICDHALEGDEIDRVADAVLKVYEHRGELADAMEGGQLDSIGLQESARRPGDSPA